VKATACVGRNSCASAPVIATESSAIKNAAVGRRLLNPAEQAINSREATIQSIGGCQRNRAATRPQPKAIAISNRGCFPPQNGGRIGSTVGPGEFTSQIFSRSSLPTTGFLNSSSY